MSVKEFPRIRIPSYNDIRHHIDDIKLDDVIKNLIELREQYSGDSTIDISGEGVEVQLVAFRDETDEEYQTRAQRQMDMKRRMEENDRRRYLELHARLGGKIEP